TDVAGHGRSVLIRATGDAFCPVAALAQFIRQFPAPPHAPLLAFSIPTTPWTQQQFSNAVRDLAGVLHFPPGISGHSLRVGGFTHGIAAGVPVEYMVATGGWTSDAFRRYIRQTPSGADAFAAASSAVSNPRPPRPPFPGSSNGGPSPRSV
ncbi:hypothetical protein HDU96_005349, partial [Phlyctochytrium bullatum]